MKIAKWTTYLLIAAGIILLILFLNQTKSTPIKSGSTSSQTKASAPPDCSGELTPSQTEGPYYKSGSPERKSLIETGVVGEKITVTGYVFDQDCKPVAKAWLDFWQADGNGNYDNQSFRLRGYQFTDEKGGYTLETVMPGGYSNRTPHIHLKVKAANGPVLTTQLYFPDQPRNQTDSIFNQALIANFDGKTASFNFVIPTE